MKNKNILWILVLFIIVIVCIKYVNNLFTSQIPSECPTYGEVVYDSGKRISTEGEAEELFLEYANKENPTILRQSSVGSMIPASGTTYLDENVEGWSPYPHKSFIISRSGKVYLFAKCE